MMKGFFITLVVLVAAALPHPATADNTGYWLVLSMRDGSTAAHPYADRPTIIIKNGLFTVKTATNTVDYPAKSIDRFRLTASYVVPKLKGDVNNDGSVDIADIATVITVMASPDPSEGGENYPPSPNPSEGIASPDPSEGGENYPPSPNPSEVISADVNGDGAVDVADIAEIISIMAKS